METVQTTAVMSALVETPGMLWWVGSVLAGLVTAGLAWLLQRRVLTPPQRRPAPQPMIPDDDGPGRHRAATSHDERREKWPPVNTLRSASASARRPGAHRYCGALPDRDWRMSKLVEATGEYTREDLAELVHGAASDHRDVEWAVVDTAAASGAASAEWPASGLPAWLIATHDQTLADVQHYARSATGILRSYSPEVTANALAVELLAGKDRVDAVARLAAVAIVELAAVGGTARIEADR